MSLPKQSGGRAAWHALNQFVTQEGGFVVTVPALDGCVTQGETEKEALKNAKEAIKVYYEVAAI